MAYPQPLSVSDIAQSRPKAVGLETTPFPSFANDPIASNKIENAIITALIVAAFAIIGSGFWQWINAGGK